MTVMTLLQAGRTGEAIALLERHLAQRPDDLQALLLLARVLAGQGAGERALGLLQRAVTVAPECGEAHLGIAELERARGRFDAAAAAYVAATRHLPQDPVPPYNHATLLQQGGQLEACRGAYALALQRNPRFTPALINLGNLAYAASRFDEAEAYYERARAVEGGLPEAHAGLGLLAERRGDLDAAERAFREAIRLRPGHPGMAETYNNLGSVLFRRGNPAEARQLFETAIRLRGGEHPLATDNLIATLMQLRQFEAMLALTTQAIGQRPDDANLRVERLFAALNLCRWETLDADVRMLDALPPERLPDRVGPFHSIAVPGIGRQRLCAMTAAFAARQLACLPPDTPPPDLPSPARLAGEAMPARLRIGYLSGDFHAHATSFLLVGVLEQHDRARFETFAYSYGPDDGSTMRARVVRAFDTFREVSGLSDLAVAQRIREDCIDLLVDLKGWTEGGRPEILFYRPAPVQVSWLGYPGTLGDARLADYLIGDPVVTPLAHADGYAETLALLPDCYQPNDRARTIGRLPTRAEAGLPPEGFVFCSFNQAFKFNPATLDVWCRLLAATPGSVLWLLDPGEIARQNLLRAAGERGVAPARLIFAPRLPVDEHLGRLRLADLALDTWPCNSHTTAADALWTGLPLLTCTGDTFASRVAASLLQAVGLPDLVTGSLDAYLDLALRLAADPGHLRALRERLAGNLPQAPLFDTGRFTTNLERLYTAMWQAHRAGTDGPIVL